MGERERRHFDAISAAMTADADARIDEAMAMSPTERVLAGLRLGASTPMDDAKELELDRRARAQAEIHVRFRQVADRRATRSG